MVGLAEYCVFNGERSYQSRGSKDARESCIGRFTPKSE